MNSCILMAEIVKEPELRYTSDNQTPLTEMMVQIPGLRPEDAMATLKVVGWGNLAQEIQANYHEGDRVVIEGRLSMNTIDRTEGFKEKRAEVTVQRLHRLGSDWESTSSTAATSSNSKDSSAADRTNGNTTPRSGSSPKAKSSVAKFSAPPETVPDANMDDIPF